jgi:hypothetical protein
MMYVVRPESMNRLGTKKTFNDLKKIYLYCNMLVPINKLLLHIVAMQIKAIAMSWDQLLYAFADEGRRQDVQPVLHNVFCLLVTPQTLAGQKIFV